MKAVILAGGLGTRISEETVTRPKPMIEIGGKPILWHLMKIYSAFGIDEFVVCLGYKGDRFTEKPEGDGGWINGGFFVLAPAALDYIDGDATIWERDPLERLASDGELMAYRHTGYWQAMDTLRDKNPLESQWASGTAPWRRW